MLAGEVYQVEQFMAFFTEEVVKHGVSLMSDGWTSMENKPIVNFLAATGDCCVYLNALDTSDEIKDGSFISGEITKCIESCGMKSVIDQSVKAADLPPSRKKKSLPVRYGQMGNVTDLHAAGFVLDPESHRRLMIERIYREDVQLPVKAMSQHAVYRAGQGLFASDCACKSSPEGNDGQYQLYGGTIEWSDQSDGDKDVE
ncbi:hypothetical protein CHS0354_008091 [Potamilus streckersoni]|uniref:DUF659 domain-containing protein n=1 Tax=Potamilus streckersoni TaxID=2493646 RepID=A0AAE0SZK2_9BIVA|nr:hypothetical protein CHS0354_008091 [Potamilus streckersoni]